jgi:gluconokinase
LRNHNLNPNLVYHASHHLIFSCPKYRITDVYNQLLLEIKRQNIMQNEQHTVSSASPTPPAPPLILALDVGTSSTRTLLFDATGAAITSVHAQRPYKLTLSSAGEVSVDADALLAVVTQTIDDALAAAGPLAEQIGAIAIDTFWHGLLGVDAQGEPLTPLITWEDTRPYTAARQLRGELDEEAIHARTGARLHASYWPAKLRWLATEQADTFARVAQWLSFGEYLHRKLLGHSVCSLSMASATGMLNAQKQQWDEELMHALHVQPEQLPTLGDASNSITELRAPYAAQWPTLRHVPWFPALGDGATACVGSGCATNDRWSLTIGTSSAMRVVVQPSQVTPPMALWQYLLDAKRAVVGGALSEGGNLLNWLANTLKLPTLPDAEPLVAAVPPDSHGLTLLPFISGERSLGWHADARLTMTGMTTHTTPADLLRAGMESLAYQLGGVYAQLRACLHVSEDNPPKVVASGGALLGSKTLQQIIADTLGTPLYPSHDSEASARGAALMALEALGVLPNITQVAPSLASPTMPNAHNQDVYQQAAARQRALYKALLGESL